MQVQIIETSIPYPQGLPRSEGVHVSGLIRGMAVEYGLLDKKWVDPNDLSLMEVTGDGEHWWANLDPDSRVRMSIGLAWEQWYLPQLPYVNHQPGEVQVDGIYMTLDGESLDVIVTAGQRDGYVLAVHEVKTTSKSTRTVGDLSDTGKNWMWLTQTKAYCKAKNTRICYLHVLFLYGDYSYPMRPLLVVYRIEFEQWEIDDAWSLITDYLRQQRLLGRVS